MARASAATVLLDQATKVASALAPRGLAGLNFPIRNGDLSLGLASGPLIPQEEDEEVS